MSAHPTIRPLLKGWFCCTHPDCNEQATAVIFTSTGRFQGDASCPNEKHAADLLDDADWLDEYRDGETIDEMREQGFIR